MEQLTAVLERLMQQWLHHLMLTPLLLQPGLALQEVVARLRALPCHLPQEWYLPTPYPRLRQG